MMNRATISGAIEIGRAPGVVQVTFRAPVDALAARGLDGLAREQYGAPAGESWPLRAGGTACSVGAGFARTASSKGGSDAGRDRVGAWVRVRGARAGAWRVNALCEHFRATLPRGRPRPLSAWRETLRYEGFRAKHMPSSGDECSSHGRGTDHIP